MASLRLSYLASRLLYLASAVTSSRYASRYAWFSSADFSAAETLCPSALALVNCMNLTFFRATWDTSQDDWASVFISARRKSHPDKTTNHFRRVSGETSLASNPLAPARTCSGNSAKDKAARRSMGMHYITRAFWCVAFEIVRCHVSALVCRVVAGEALFDLDHGVWFHSAAPFRLGVEAGWSCSLLGFDSVADLRQRHPVLRPNPISQGGASQGQIAPHREPLGQGRQPRTAAQGQIAPHLEPLGQGRQPRTAAQGQPAPHLEPLGQSPAPDHVPADQPRSPVGMFLGVQHRLRAGQRQRPPRPVLTGPLQQLLVFRGPGHLRLLSLRAARAEEIASFNSFTPGPIANTFGAWLMIRANPSSNSRTLSLSRSLSASREGRVFHRRLISRARSDSTLSARAASSMSPPKG